MVEYDSSNVMLATPFKTRKYQHRPNAYNSIIQRLKNRGLTTDLQILYNEASKNYKAIIKDKWGVGFQLVPPDIQRINSKEREIRTFEAHVLAVLSVVALDYTQIILDLLLVQT